MPSTNRRQEDGQGTVALSTFGTPKRAPNDKSYPNRGVGGTATGSMHHNNVSDSPPAPTATSPPPPPPPPNTADVDTLARCNEWLCHKGVHKEDDDDFVFDQSVLDLDDSEWIYRSGFPDPVSSTCFPSCTLYSSPCTIIGLIYLLFIKNLSLISLPA